MTITSIPTRDPADLGAALTNTRPPAANDLSAVNIERIKDRLIEVFGEVGLSDGSTAGSIHETLLSLATEAFASAGRALLETLAGTSDTLADADSGKIIRCTNGSTVTITVPSGLTPGTTVEYVQEGAGQVRISGSGVTLRHSDAFNPYTADQYSSIVVTILDTDEALVRGDLAPV